MSGLLGSGPRYPELFEDPADRRGTYSAADLQELALDALVAPRWVLSRKLFDQPGDFGVDGRTSGAVR
jgi:hypothetical protein